jgi:lysophospholipase L1-like esterase
MNKNKILNLLLIAILFSASVQAQGNLPYWNEVQAFKKQDSIQFPSANQILFIGSSSFTNWKDLQQNFPSYPILNRAFGGSSLTDLIQYRYEVLYAYQPKQIIMYCGENDFAASDTVTVKTVLQRFKTFFQLMRTKYKTVPFAYVSMKPSPSRVQLMPKYEEANKQIKLFLSKKTRTVFVDVYHAMLNKDGAPMKDIFLVDSLHMNAKGYAIWKKKLGTVLIK